MFKNSIIPDSEIVGSQIGKAVGYLFSPRIVFCEWLLKRTHVLGSQDPNLIDKDGHILKWPEVVDYAREIFSEKNISGETPREKRELLWATKILFLDLIFSLRKRPQ